MILHTTSDLAHHHRNELLTAAADARLARQARPHRSVRSARHPFAGLRPLARRLRRAAAPNPVVNPSPVPTGPCTERTVPAT